MNADKQIRELEKRIERCYQERANAERMRDQATGVTKAELGQWVERIDADIANIQQQIDNLRDGPGGLWDDLNKKTGRK